MFSPPTTSSRNAMEGFTLIELMIVVVIMGVLAAVAIMSYTIYIRRARAAEAVGLVSNIKANQESYRAEFGTYCNVNVGGLGDPGDPSDTRLDWSTASDPDWVALGFRPDEREIWFSLDTIAGGPITGGDAKITAWLTTDIVSIPGTVDELTADHWFIARALGDQDGDGTRSCFSITSMSSRVASFDPTE